LSPTRPPISAPLRAWQERALAELAGWRAGPFLLSAAPGAGKTRPALELARERHADGVVVLCPTAPLTRQWAAAAAHLGLELLPDAPTARPPRGFHGVAVTYSRVAADPGAWARSVPPRALVVVDEAHHLGEELAWGQAFVRAFGGAPRWLLLSGTPFRSDATPIPGVRYEDELAVPDFSYGYAEAVRDGVCRPVAFVTYDGTLSWRSGEEEMESTFDVALPAREAARRYRTAISAQLPDGLPRILREADARLEQIRAAEAPHAAGLVVAADSSHARHLAALLREINPPPAPPVVVVLHTEARAAEKLAAFRHSRERWIVAVNMVSEGVDIPRLRVGVYATAAKTALVFRQIVGRFVRTTGAGPHAPSFLYLAADPLLRTHASEIEHELARPRRREHDDDLIAQEPFEPAEGEPRTREEAPAFVPLGADVSPQLTLFGPPAGAPAALARPALDAPALAPPASVPAHERRAALRERRRRLVAELCRSAGGGHREVNAWLNRRVGVGRVEEASIGQLERSVELLLAELARTAR
jgi:superfamily II DNA or RNA helicase